jgi:DNA-binding NarL/FixJ family response regulator
MSDRTPRAYRRWQAAEIEVMRRILDAGGRWADVAAHFGVSTDAAKAIGLLRGVRRPHRRLFWTPERERRLLNLSAQGVRQSEIARLFDTTPAAVAAALRRARKGA